MGNTSTFEQCMIETLQEQLNLSQSNVDLVREEFKKERNARIHDMNEMNTALSNECDAMAHEINFLNIRVSSR